MATPGAVNTAHQGETSFDPFNLTGQLFMKGRRENTVLQLIGGMNAITGVKSKEFDCGQNFEVPDHTTLPERLEGGVAPAFEAVQRSQAKNVVEPILNSISTSCSSRQ